jgi:hypothetical protein
MAAPIGLPPKGAKFCHTSNRLLVRRQRCRALLQLYFNSSVVSYWLFAGWLVGWLVDRSVQKKGSRALGVSPQKNKTNIGE